MIETTRSVLTAVSLPIVVQCGGFKRAIKKVMPKDRQCCFILLAFAFLSAHTFLFSKQVRHEVYDENIWIDNSANACHTNMKFSENLISRIGTLLISMNLKDSASLLSNMLVQIRRLNHILGYRKIYVSIYESSSTDGTNQMLEIISKSLHVSNIPHSIVTHGSLVRGDRHRIDHLAELRNAALKPLFEKPFDRVVFINDVYFCAEDVILLALQDDADIACGLDFAKPDEFYDSWVARTMEGMPFRNFPPYIWTGAVSINARNFKTYMKGLNNMHVVPIESNSSIPVGCCWNGLAVMRSEPFYNGTRFRRNFPGECGSCECSLLCNDFVGKGFNRFVVVTSVRVAYSPEVFKYIGIQRHQLYSSHVTASNYNSIKKLSIKTPFQNDPTPPVCFGLSSSNGTDPNDKPVISGFEIGRSLARVTCMSHESRQLIFVGMSRTLTKYNQYIWAWKSLHPGFVYLIFDEINSLKFIHHSGIKSHLKRLISRQRTDQFTMFAGAALLEIFGGIYIPFDVLPVVSISCLEIKTNFIIPINSSFGNIVGLIKGRFRSKTIYTFISNSSVDLTSLNYTHYIHTLTPVTPVTSSSYIT